MQSQGRSLNPGTVRMRSNRDTGSTMEFSEDICLEFVAFLLLRYILLVNLLDLACLHII